MAERHLKTPSLIWVYFNRSMDEYPYAQDSEI